MNYITITCTRVHVLYHELLTVHWMITCDAQSAFNLLSQINFKINKSCGLTQAFEPMQQYQDEIGSSLK